MNPKKSEYKGRGWRTYCISGLAATVFLFLARSSPAQAAEVEPRLILKEASGPILFTPDGKCLDLGRR
jgi:hypothetical protein